MFARLQPSRWGCDEYGRYYQTPDGERVAVEFYPFNNPRLKILYAGDMLLWWLFASRRCTCTQDRPQIPGDRS